MVYELKIKNTPWIVIIGGFRDASIDDIDGFLSSIREAVAPYVFQVFNAERIAGWRHLFFAAVNAVNAFKVGTTISRNLAIEVMLYASCQNQISEAFDLVGISSYTEKVALLILTNTLKSAKKVFELASNIIGTKDDQVLQLNKRKTDAIKEIFKISDLEFKAVRGNTSEALTNIIIEV